MRADPRRRTTGAVTTNRLTRTCSPLLLLFGELLGMVLAVHRVKAAASYEALEQRTAFEPPC